MWIPHWRRILQQWAYISNKRSNQRWSVLWNKTLMNRVSSGKCTSNNVTYMTTEWERFINQNTQIFNDIDITYRNCCDTESMQLAGWVNFKKWSNHEVNSCSLIHQVLAATPSDSAGARSMKAGFTYSRIYNHWWYVRTNSTDAAQDSNRLSFLQTRNCTNTSLPFLGKNATRGVTVWLTEKPLLSALKIRSGGIATAPLLSYTIDSYASKNDSLFLCWSHLPELMK